MSKIFILKVIHGHFLFLIYKGVFTPGTFCIELVVYTRSEFSGTVFRDMKLSIHISCHIQVYDKVPVIARRPKHFVFCNFHMRSKPDAVSRTEVFLNVNAPPTTCIKQKLYICPEQNV